VNTALVIKSPMLQAESKYVCHAAKEHPHLAAMGCVPCSVDRSACGRGSARPVWMWSILRHAVPVILEHALLPVKPGEEGPW
jgi:hypothetical protein